MNSPRPILFLCAFALALAASSAPRASAYIDVSPTLGQIIRESRNIALVRVDKANREKRIVIYTKVADLKGYLPDDHPVRHQLTDGHPPREPRHILDWAAPGQTAVVFNYRNTMLVCIGHRSEEHTSELQSQSNLVCRLLLEKKKKKKT